MPKLVCCNCQTELEIEKNGVSVVEMFSQPPQPYRIWSADLWKCPQCQNEIVAGFGMQPLAEHFQEKFNDILERVKSGTVFYDYEIRN